MLKKIPTNQATKKEEKKKKNQPPKKAPKTPTEQLFNAHERADCVKLNIPLSIY